MVKKIQLTQGKETLVDDEDYDELAKYSWGACYDADTNSYYVRRGARTSDGRNTTIGMHQHIMGFPSKKGMKVDHINHNPLDNRRCNLRVCSNSSNRANHRLQKNNSSGLNGVYWHKRDKAWRAQLKYQNKQITLGNFPTREKASRAVDARLKQLFGEFAHLNKQRG